MARLEDLLRTCLVGWGFLEARSISFVPESDGDVPLLLPLSANESRLRRALVSGLLRRLQTNFNRGARDLRLFEIGTVFAPGDGGMPRETTRLAAVMTGARQPPHWSETARDWDLWDLRGLIEDLAGRCGLVVDPDVAPGSGVFFPAAPGQAFSLRSADGEARGLAGRVVATAVDAPAWAAPVWALELDLDDAMKPAAVGAFRPLPTQPAVERDIALVLPPGATAGPIGETIRSAAGPMLESVFPFDVYAGKGLPPGARSVAFRVRFRAADRTLTDAEVDRFMNRVLDRLREEHNVERRS
jgi:phenylalanyl-tRNA synthetase beta chain